MMIVLTMFARDLRARLRDRSALVLALLAPAALITVLSLLAAGPETEEVPIGVVARGGSPLAQAITQGPLTELEKDGTIRLTSYDDEASLREAIDDERVDGGVVVAADGQSVHVIQGADAIVAGAILEAVSRSTALTLDGISEAVHADRALGGNTPPRELAAAVVAAPATSEVVDATEGADGIDPKTQVAAGMATFFLFFSVQFGVLGLLQERREGTLPRLLAAPVAPWQVLVSKLLVSLVIGLASMVTLALFSSWLLGASWGDPLGVAMLIFAGVLAAVATVTLVVGLARTPEQAGATQAVVALVLGILGGAFFSMARAGGVAAVASRLTPHYWFNEGLVQLTGGRDWTSAVGPTLALLLFTVLIGVPGLLLAGRIVRP
jgi:ABC-2 type transport system permease protein